MKSASFAFVLDIPAIFSRASAARRYPHPGYLLVSVHPVACILSVCYANSTSDLFIFSPSKKIKILITRWVNVERSK